MGTGLIPRGCRWAEDGAGTARLPDMKAKLLRRTFWRHSATLATPTVARGRHASGRGMQSGLRSWLHLVRRHLVRLRRDR